MLVAAAAVLSGCGSPFLHSPSSEATAATDPGIVGEWITTEPQQIRAQITPPSPDTPNHPYSAALTVHDKDALKTSLSLELVLMEIGNTRYADLFLARPERDQLVGRYGFLVVPVHQVMKIVREADTLTVWPFRGDWLESAAQSETFSHDRVTVGGGDVAIVTASTGAIRDLLARHADDPKAFGDPIVFRRVSSPR
jgi:hypothetical protein